MRIILATGRFREVLAEQQLRRLERTYPLSQWTFTSDIRVEFGALPHSHPVLTLNTRHLDDDDRVVHPSGNLYRCGRWRRPSLPQAYAAYGFTNRNLLF
jgi:hypothetical protein